jgi:serine/threonine-protein kinase
MTPERWEQLRPLLAAAIEVPVDQRTTTYLDRLCQSDSALVVELQALLAAHEQPEAARLDVAMFRFSADRSDLLLLKGTRLASYEILSPLGAGGMGDVYCARDTKLGRDVALKILPDSFARDPDRLARFRREAHLLASLNHPHIAAIYGLEEIGTAQFLVLELVDGETLDKRIARGPIPDSESLAIAKQIAEALEAAHEKGIIHRDLKPANIALTKESRIKLLDFGLAKAGEPSEEAPVEPASGQTVMTLGLMSSASLIVGTPAYMAPEQARGKIVDKRADIWAFGVVVYEMLTARRAFAGDSKSVVLTNVLEAEPNWAVLPDAVPQRMRQLLMRCLAKNPKTRLRDIGEARVLIDELLDTRSNTDVARAFVGTESRRPWAITPWLITAALALGMAITVWMLGRRPEPAVARLSIELGADVSLTNTDRAAATAISPDGNVMAFVGQRPGGDVQLYLRRLARMESVPLAGTDGAQAPFFSPDGQSIAFFAAGHLKKMPVSSGPPVTLADVQNPIGGSWGDDNTIIFSPATGPKGRLLRMSSAGGTPTQVATLAPGEVNQRWPDILPGSNAVLFTSWHAPGSFSNADIVALSLTNGTRHVVVRGGSYPRYVRSGHLLYVNDGRLLAVPFDTGRLETAGQPVTVIEGIASNQLAVSASGTLVYLRAPIPTGGVPIQWLDHTGALTPLRKTATNWRQFEFSPDGRRLALTIADAVQNDIWVYEWAQDRLTRLTLDPADDTKAVWAPDGRRIVFASTRGDKSTRNLYWQLANGTGDAQRLTNSAHDQAPASWHPSGKFLAFHEIDPETNFDLMILPMEGDEASGWKPGVPKVFLKTPFSELGPMFSPDGRWIAYHSNESGHFEVYVRPFPGPGGKWQISNGGGLTAKWSRTKPELFYRTTDNQIMVAAYTVDGNAFRAEQPRLWSERRFQSPADALEPFALHPDGERFALTSAEAAEGPRRDHVTLILNVFEELRRLAPVTR